MRDAVFSEELIQGDKVEAYFFGDNIEGSARGDRRVEVGEESVESETGIGNQPGACINAQYLFILAHVIRHIPLAQHTSLGLSGGTAGIKKYEQVVRSDDCIRAAVRQRGDVRSAKLGSVI